MNDYPATPVMTKHARERCAEMGISTKVAKAIVRDPDLDVESLSKEGCRVARKDEYPKYAVAYVPGEPPVILTVLFQCLDFYERSGSTYIPKPEVAS